MKGLRQTATAVGGDYLLGWDGFQRTFGNLDLERRRERGRFRGHVRDSRFGDLTVRKVHTDGATQYGQHSPGRAVDDARDMVWLCLLERGSVSLAQQGAPAQLCAGDFAIVDMQQPFTIEIQSIETETLWMGASRFLIKQHICNLEDVLGCRIEGDKGAGVIASRVLTSALAGADTFAGVAASRMMHALMDVLAAAADQQRMRISGSSYRNAIKRRVKAYIESRLSDETLTVAEIAAQHSLSPRHLSKIFEDEAQSVSGWLWSRRLERCHAALKECGSERKVSEIAFSHGFKNVSHFSRAFRDRYGVSPRSVQ